MRAIRLKFSAKVKEYVAKEVKKDFLLDDVGFIEDLLALIVLKGNGVPSNSRVLSLAKVLSKKTGTPEVLTTMMLRKRQQVLRNLTKSPYFPALLAIEPLKALVRLVTLFTTLYRKVRKVQCETCPLSSGCQFAKEYAKKTLDIRQVIDKDWDKKVSPNCPNYPDISAANQLDQANHQFAAQLKQQQAGQNTTAAVSGQNEVVPSPPSSLQPNFILIDDEAEAEDPDDEANFVPPTSCSSFGKGADAALVHDANAYLDSLIDVTKRLSEKNLLIYELGAKLDFMLDQARKDKLRDVKHIAKEKETTRIKNVSELAQALPSELAKPDDVLTGSIAKKAVLRTQNKDPQDKKHLMYLLVDISGSMQAQLTGNGPLRVLTRAEMAKVLVLSFAKRLRKEGGILYLRHFSTTSGPLRKIEGDDDFEFFINSVAAQRSNGGGTNISGALRTAIKDIEQAKDKLSESDILLISDAEDCINSAEIEGLLRPFKKNPLHTLDVAEGQTRYSSGMADAASVVLKRLSAKYYHVDPHESVSLEDIVKLAS